MIKLYLRHLFLIFLLLKLTLLASADLYMDYASGTEFWHLIVEALVILVSISGVIFVLHKLFSRQQELKQLREQFSKSESDRKAELRSQVPNAGMQYMQIIQQQFTNWGLTPSEKDVSILLLKGLTFEEIANVRQTKEKTVRQQATSIYRKSGLSGRHEFAAWFFEDFLQ